MKHIYIAGGGTGGHIYPALAVAQEISRLEPACKITFLCSQRPIDARILGISGFNFIPLPAKGFPKNPFQIFSFLKSLFSTKKTIKKMFIGDISEKKMLFSIGGFVSAPAVFTANSLKIPIAMLNIDAVPGKANRLVARYAKDIFVQFEKTAAFFSSSSGKITVTGCPLRRAFFNPDKNKIIQSLNLSPKKNILLVTGASGGATNINNIIIYLLNKLDGFASDWQIVHLTGIQHYNGVAKSYSAAKISYKILDYCDDMPDLLAAASIVIARAGAMSVAEFAAAGVPAICLPYPYHRDKHQRLNAQYLADAGCGIIIDDLCDTQKTAQLLWPPLCELMNSKEKRTKMKTNCAKIVNPDAAAQIAQKLLNY